MTVNHKKMPSNMMSPKLTMWLATWLLIAAQAAPARAQFEELNSSDMQFFSPVEFDFDNHQVRKSSGYYFRYDKLSWAMTGERISVGNPNAVVLSELVYPGNPGNDQDLPAPPPYRIFNGLQDVPPTADFGWGERYEFGRLDNGNGWMIGIIDGPEINTVANFGNGPESTGFGSIHVNFATPTGYLLGWRDYQIQTINGSNFVTGQNQVINGPGGNADGVVDDIDGDALDGFFFFGIDFNGDGTIDDDEVTGNGVDFGDGYQFNITFDRVSLRNTSETQGIELMKTHRLSNGHRLEKSRDRHFDIGYGVRFLRLRDRFQFDGTSPLLGTMNFSTEAENQLVGPQIRAQWMRQQGRMTWSFDGRCMLAYNVMDADQVGSFGLDNVDPTTGLVINQGLTPGAINRPYTAQPNGFSTGRRDNEFSPTIEIRADASYQVTSAIAARLGYTGIFIDNISRGASITNYTLPDFGFLAGGEQDIFINGVNFGFDVIY